MMEYRLFAQEYGKDVSFGSTFRVLKQHEEMRRFEDRINKAFSFQWLPGSGIYKPVWYFHRLDKAQGLLAVFLDKGEGTGGDSRPHVLGRIVALCRKDEHIPLLLAVQNSTVNSFSCDASGILTVDCVPGQGEFDWNTRILQPGAPGSYTGLGKTEPTPTKGQDLGKTVPTPTKGKDPGETVPPPTKGKDPGKTVPPPAKVRCSSYWSWGLCLVLFACSVGGGIYHFIRAAKLEDSVAKLQKKVETGDDALKLATSERDNFVRDNRVLEEEKARLKGRISDLQKELKDARSKIEELSREKTANEDKYTDPEGMIKALQKACEVCYKKLNDVLMREEESSFRDWWSYRLSDKAKADIREIMTDMKKLVPEAASEQ